MLYICLKILDPFIVGFCGKVVNRIIPVVDGTIKIKDAERATPVEICETFIKVLENFFMNPNN